MKTLISKLLFSRFIFIFVCNWHSRTHDGSIKHSNNILWVTKITNIVLSAIFISYSPPFFLACRSYPRDLNNIPLSSHNHAYGYLFITVRKILDVESDLRPYYECMVFGLAQFPIRFLLVLAFHIIARLRNNKLTISIEDTLQ